MCQAKPRPIPGDTKVISKGSVLYTVCYSMFSAAIEASEWCHVEVLGVVPQSIFDASSCNCCDVAILARPQRESQANPMVHVNSQGAA